MDTKEKRLFSMRLSFLRHLTEAIYVTYREGGSIPEESIEKLNEVSNALYQQHRKLNFSKV